MSEVSKHFNNIARDYDYWKKRNWYYYENLKRILKEFIPPQSRVLDVGCGTGDLLAALQPIYGVGIDISEEMIKVARQKHQSRGNLFFYQSGDEQQEKFDFIIVVDVVEHVENLEDFIKNLSKFCHEQSKIIILMANPLWEPLLLLLEKLELKMPEGPHKRTPFEKIKRIFEKNNFKIVEHGYRQLVPKRIYFFSDFVNRCFYKIPLIKNLGLTEYFVLRYESFDK